MNKNRIVKRYQNRKLYDTYKSCYVTLDQIAEMLREGDDVTVIDNKTQKDITGPTLIQIIFEAEKKASNPIPTPILKNIIRKGNGSILEYITSSISEGIVSRFLVREELEKRFDSLVQRSVLTSDDSTRILNEIVEASNLESVHKDLSTDSSYNTELQGDINNLQEKLTTLEDKL